MGDKNVHKIKNFTIDFAIEDLDKVQQIVSFMETAGYTLADTVDNVVHNSFCLMVLSPNFVLRHRLRIWTFYFAEDPIGENHLLIPVKIAPCNFGPLIENLKPVDLTGNLTPEEARNKLLEGVSEERTKPLQSPPFPGGA